MDEPTRVTVIEIIVIHENDRYYRITQVADQCNSQFEIASGERRNMSNLVTTDDELGYAQL